MLPINTLHHLNWIAINIMRGSNQVFTSTACSRVLDFIIVYPTFEPLYMCTSSPSLPNPRFFQRTNLLLRWAHILYLIWAEKSSTAGFQVCKCNDAQLFEFQTTIIMTRMPWPLRQQTKLCSTSQQASKQRQSIWRLIHLCKYPLRLLMAVL